MVDGGDVGGVGEVWFQAYAPFRGGYMVFLDTYDVVVVEGVADELHFPGGGVAEAARVPGEDAEARVAALLARAGDRCRGRWAAPGGWS